jgi:competence protein ComEC
MTKPRSHRVPLIAAITIALSLGTLAAEYLVLPTSVLLAVSWALTPFLVATHCVPCSVSSRRLLFRVGCLLLIGVLAATRGNIAALKHDSLPLHQLAMRGDVTIVMDVRVESVPYEYERPVSEFGSERSSDSWQTRFTADCVAVYIEGQPYEQSGRLRVFVDGRAAARCQRGDSVQLTGRLSWPQLPGNPGEFDFVTFLKRRQVAGMFYVGHPSALHVTHQVGWLNPGYWLTRLRRDAWRALNQAVDADNRGIATALLLGSRNEVRAETEEVFIGSGTMHLLAISGLHIGILCLLLIRLGHWLLIPWNQRLVLIALFCIVYAMITDLRPSVVRATVFVVLFTVSQIALRQVAFIGIISLTACLMLLWQPHLVFDTGAWLSFLSVLSLAQAARIVPLEVLRDSSQSPTESSVAITPAERWADVRDRTWHWLAFRYRPMLWILAATLPLTASEFHVLSPITLVVNVLLIGWTVFALWSGFTAIVFGMLLPSVTNPAGSVFSLLLTGLKSMVEAAAGPGVGHVYLADLPGWFLPTWYVLLVLAIVLQRRWHQRVAWLCLCGITSIILAGSDTNSEHQTLRCTVLDIGHGSASVLEFPDGSVMLVDAGAMNRGDRGGETVSRFLWNCGHRMISTVLVSHADVDHFNALRTVFVRFPVGQLIVAQTFVQNDAPSVQRLLELAREHRIPIRIVGDGERCQIGQTQLQLRQASPVRLFSAHSDNEKSIVVQIEHAGRALLLPGDLEGDAMDSVLPSFKRQDVLISPHHGSLKANTPPVAAKLKPTHVVVSAGDDDYRDRLSEIYRDSTLYFTSESGAIAIDIWPDGRLNIRQHRNFPSAKDVMNDVPVNIGQSHVSSTESERQAFVVDAAQVEHCGMQVVNLDSVFDCVISEFVGCSINRAAFDASTGQPVGETKRIVVSTVFSLSEWCAAELARPNHECLFE